jgi:hypothetical protein
MKDVFTEGPGPFVTPLLAEFRGVNLGDGLDHCVLEFRFEDGATIQLPMSIQAAEALNLSMAVWISKRGAPDGTKH